MRIMFKNQAVLTCTRFTFVAIAQNILGLGRLLRNERPLQAGVEPGSSAPTQPGVLNLINNSFGLHAERLLHGFVAVEFEIAIDMGRTLTKTFGNDLYFVGMGNQISHFEIRNSEQRRSSPSNSAF